MINQICLQVLEDATTADFTHQASLLFSCTWSCSKKEISSKKRKKGESIIGCGASKLMI